MVGKKLSRRDKPKQPVIIFRVRPDKDVMMAALIITGAWEQMSLGERYAATKRGEIWDTSAGRAFSNRLREAKAK